MTHNTNTPISKKSSFSVDDDLAMATSTGLRLDSDGGSPTSTAPTTPTVLDATTTFVGVGAASVFLPKKKDKSGLYWTTLGDGPMTTAAAAAAGETMTAMTTVPPPLPPLTPHTSSAGPGAGDADDDGRSLTGVDGGVGVPGFPDFPACWVGEEGGARPRHRRTPSSRGSGKRAEKRAARRMRITRSAVNSTSRMLLRSFRKNQKRMAREERRMHREERRCQREARRKSKRDLADISRSLASLKCS